MAHNNAILEGALRERISWLEQELSIARRQLADLHYYILAPLKTSSLPVSTDASTSSAATNTGSGKRKQQQQDQQNRGNECLRPRKAPKSTSSTNDGTIAPLRRPTRKSAWYSMGDEGWERINISRKRNLSHVGYIEETDAGMLAPSPCYECRNRLRPNHMNGKTEKLICMVYKPETAIRYTKATGRNSKCCSNCWTSKTPCEFVGDNLSDGGEAP